jgi:hypothetical protein
MKRDVLRRFLSYRATQLQGVVDAVRDLIRHNLTKGIEAERAPADLLKSVLLLRFAAGKGFLIDTTGRQSNEIDLIILDSMNTARLFDFRAFEIIPIEAALACIEVKTTLTKDELIRHISKISSHPGYEVRLGEDCKTGQRYRWHRTECGDHVAPRIDPFCL